MKFKYKAKDKSGQVQKGIVEASAKSIALTLLSRYGLTVISIEEQRELPFVTDILRLWNGVRAKEFVIFSRQLATLIDSRVPIMLALQSIAKQSPNRYFALVLSSIILDIDGGQALSEAMSKHPETFSGFYINMVRAGEASGTLQKTLNDLADNIEKNYELTSKLKGAMYYPAFVLSAMAAVGFFVMTFVMPKLLEILTESNVTLPIQTRILIAVSGFLTNYWWAVIILVIALIMSLSYYLKTDDGKRELDQLVLKIPVIKEILRNVYIARFAENLSTLIKSGLPITSSLLITSEVVGNEVYRTVIRAATEEIKKGGQVADVLGRSPLFPPVVVQMVQVGEQTGRINFTLGKVADFYTKETDRMVKNFSTLIEPILMVFLAVGVGILVSAVLLPIYQVATSIK